MITYHNGVPEFIASAELLETAPYCYGSYQWALGHTLLKPHAQVYECAWCGRNVRSYSTDLGVRLMAHYSITEDGRRIIASQKGQ